MGQGQPGAALPVEQILPDVAATALQTWMAPPVPAAGQGLPDAALMKRAAAAAAG